MSTVKTNNVQIGQSLTATNNFTWYQPSSPDGTVRLGNGNAGSVTDLVTVNSSGNVGIGTSSPTGISGYTALTLGGSSSKGLLTFRSSSASDSGYLYHTGSSIELAALSTTPLNLTTSNANLTLGTVGTTRVTLDQSGNLGLGVTPSAWFANSRVLQITTGVSIEGRTNDGTTVQVGANYYLDSSATYRYLTTNYAQRYTQSAGYHYWYTAPSGTAGNAISFTQAMTLDAGGTLLIGQTTNPATSSVVVKVPTGTGNGVNAQITSNTGTSYPWSNYNASGTYVGGISCTSSATAFPTSSDERLKENVQDASDTLNALLAVKIRSFDWKIDGAHQEYGVVAQEIQPHIPEAILVSPGEGDYLSVDYTKIVPRLVKAIQELSAELNELKAKVNA